MKILSSSVLLAALLSFDGSDAFVPPTCSRSSPSSPQQLTMASEDSDFMSSLTSNLEMRWKIFQESSDYGFKQKMANVIAGEYDSTAIREELETMIASAPCVMFTWEASPSCKQAVAQFEKMGVQYKNIRLDNPWSTGNVYRAELGKMVGRSSVPAVFIDGKYVGGFDGGVDDAEAPGLVDMAFAGTLRSKLEAAGAMSSDADQNQQAAQPVVPTQPEVAAPKPTIHSESSDISIPYDAAAKLAYEASDKSMAYDAFKTKYESDAVEMVKSKQKKQ